MAKYEIIVRTARTSITRQDDAGTDSAVFIKLNGTQGQTRFMKLRDKPFVDEYEPGKTDVYILDIDKPLGTIGEIEVHTDGTGKNSAWRLRDVLVNGRLFPAKDFVLTLKNKFYVKLNSSGPVADSPVQPDNKPPTIIVVRTTNWVILPRVGLGDGPGTDSKIYLTIVGSKRTTKEFRLANTLSGNPFETGEVDTFSQNLTAFGDAKRIILRSDGSGRLSTWGVSSVTVNNLVFRAGLGNDGLGSQPLTIGRGHGLRAYLSLNGVEARFGDLTPQNAVSLLDKPIGPMFAWAAENDSQESIVTTKIVSQSGRAKPFADRFVNLKTSSSVLFDKLGPLESSTDTDTKKVAETLKQWVLNREDTLNLFKRFDDYLKGLKIDLDEELEELKAAFKRGIKVEVKYIPGEVSEDSEIMKAMAGAFNVLTAVPNPVGAALAMATTTALTMASNYIDAGLQDSRVTSQVTGGDLLMLDVIDDEFYRMGIDNKLIIDSLRKTAMRSIAMLEECSDFEQQIASAVKNVSPSKEAQVIARYFPIQEGLKEVLRPYWTRMLLAEAVLVGNDADSIDLQKPLVTEHLADSSAQSPLLSTTTWRLMLCGDDRRLIPEGATAFSKKALERIYWLFSSHELLQLMIRNNRAYRYVIYDGVKVTALGAIPFSDEGWVELSRFEGDGYLREHVELDKQKFWQIYERSVTRSRRGVFLTTVAKRISLDFVGIR